jgi:hypothetical protein
MQRFFSLFALVFHACGICPVVFVPTYPEHGGKKATLHCKEGQIWNSWTTVCQKTQVSCPMLFTVPLADFKENPYSTLVLKIHTKKSAKQENSSLFMNSIFKKGKMRVENWTKLESEKTQVYAQKPRLKRLLKNSISGNKSN